MSTNLIQTSFAAGELAPSIFAHTDLAKYKSGAAVMRNFFVDYRSGASSRAGTEFIVQAFISDKAVRLIPFQYSTSATFIIEFGDFYCRFITNAGSVLEAGFAITAATNGAPATVTAPGNTFVNGDWVYIKDMVGATRFNNRFYSVVIAGAVVTLYDVNGAPVNSLTYGAWTSGGTISRVYKISSPYAAADLAELKFVQSASVMTLTHQSYPPYTLSASAPANWTFAAIVFGTSLTAPAGVTATPTTAGAVNYAYRVTAVDADGQESAASAYAAAASINIATTAGSINVAWGAVAGAASYNVYKAEPSYSGVIPVGAGFGFIGSATGVALADTNIVPDFTISIPIADNPFSANNPNAFCYFQQRGTYAGSASQPTTFWMSQPGAFNNFDYSNPSQEDDAITGTIVSLQVNAIQSMVPMPGGLVMLTTKGAWQISGGSGGAGGQIGITPINATATPQAYNGASSVQPIVINFDIVYVQAKGSIVRDLSYNIYANIYTGTDISVLSNHLFLNYRITQWAYAEEPFKIVWAVRDDGHLLSLTFVKEQEIYGWARHDTKGLFKSVASITEGQVDAVYVVVKRKIGGKWLQMIERMDDRMFVYSNANPTNASYLPIPMIRANAESSWCVDCGSQSTLPTPAAELTASSSYGTVTFTTDAAVFAAGNVGSIIRMGGGIATIDTFVSPTEVVGIWTTSPAEVIPNDSAMIPVPKPSGSWSMTAPFTTFAGLDYLEGETVSIIADGGVVTPQVVTAGPITLASPASLVTVGIGFSAQLQTMPLDVSGGETVQGKRKQISALTVRSVNTRGLQAGSSFGTLVPIKELNPDVILGAPIPLITDDERVIMDPSWNVPGQICVQQDDPLPATILGVIPEITLGDTSGRQNS